MPQDRLFDRRAVWLLAFGVLGCLVVGFLVLWAIPMLLTRSPAVGGSARHQALADARTGVVAFVVALGAFGTLTYTIRTYLLTKRTQLADRYTKAIEQIDNDADHIRIGGIFALEHLVADDSGYRESVLKVLTAYVRVQAPWPGPPRPTPAPDVKVALQVIRALHVGVKGPHLYATNLEGADLTDWRLVDSDLTGANLCNASLKGADLRGADLKGAELAGVSLLAADLSDAQVYAGQLEPGQLADAKAQPQVVERAQPRSR